MTPEQQAELTALQRRLAARQNQQGWQDNCKAIQARIDELLKDQNT